MTQVLPPPLIPGLDHLEKLGAGGYADVYLYEQRMPSRRVAVKVLRETGLSAGVVARFTAEANAMAQLEHPHIVPVYSAATTQDGRPYLVMMYYPNASLSERAKRERFSVAEVLRIGIQISSAVETAHRAGLLHRDIKPANILTSQYGTPGLTDFGIAAQVAGADDEDTGVSVPWSPVETLYATGPATVRSDVYSLAATLWHLLVGRSPFEVPGGDNSTFTLMRRVRDVPPPATGRTDVPTSLDRLLRAAMAKDPGLRPASALEFARALQSIEQELRYPRTDIVLAEVGPQDGPVPTGTIPWPAGGVPERTPVPSEEPATRLRAPQQVQAQHPAPLPPVAGARPPVAPAARTPVAPARPTATDEDEPATVRRAVPVTPTPAAPEPVPAPVGSRPAGRRGLVALVALVAVVVGVVAVWQASGRGAEPVVPEPSRTPSQPPPGLGPDVPPPGRVTVAAQREGGSVVFTWTYTNALPSDWFQVKLPDRVERVQEPRLVVPSAERLCAAVKVYRNSGADAPVDYSQEACG